MKQLLLLVALTPILLLTGCSRSVDLLVINNSGQEVTIKFGTGESTVTSAVPPGKTHLFAQALIYNPDIQLRVDSPKQLANQFVVINRKNAGDYYYRDDLIMIQVDAHGVGTVDRS